MKYEIIAHLNIAKEKLLCYNKTIGKVISKMEKYEENISDQSLWMTATPTPLAQTLPFYITEAGQFAAGCNYCIRRNTHDSFLLLYTISGQGFVQTNETAMQLSCGYAVIIDCHAPHEYRTASDSWEFLWIHFKGSGIRPLLDIIYPDTIVNPTTVKNPCRFENMTRELIHKAIKNDIAGYLELSLGMHAILNEIYLSTLAHVSRKKDQNDDILTIIQFIEQNYSNSITVDDMVEHIHVSKYHFIRRFRRMMGITPYSYLTNYRINMSKTLLRSTNKTVSEIAELCGFLDTSNFIAQFKKHTGQKPLQYRRDFS